MFTTNSTGEEAFMTSTYSVDLQCPDCDADAALVYVMRVLNRLSRTSTPKRDGIKYTLPSKDTHVLIDVTRKNIVVESTDETNLSMANQFVTSALSSVSKAVRRASYALGHKALADTEMFNIEFAAKDETDEFTNCKDDVTGLETIPYTHTHILCKSAYKFMKTIEDHAPIVYGTTGTRQYMVPLERGRDILYLYVDGDCGLVSYLAKDYLFANYKLKQVLSNAIIECCY